MVFAFLCHSVVNDPCRVLFSTVFGREPATQGEAGTDVAAVREKHKTQLLTVAGRVHTEYKFRLAVRIAERSDSESSRPVQLAPEEVNGLFRLLPGEPFEDEKFVAWQVLQNCAFVFVLEVEENRILAEQALLLIGNLVKDYIIKDHSVAEVMTKPDKMTAILVRFLPNGQLLFLNHKMIKQYEKDIEPILSGK